MTPAIAAAVTLLAEHGYWVARPIETGEHGDTVHALCEAMARPGEVSVLLEDEACALLERLRAAGFEVVARSAACVVT